MMKTVTIRVLLGGMVSLAVCGIPATASAQTRTIRVVEYNIDADQGQNGAQYTVPQPGLIAPSSGGSVTNGGVLEGIGEEIVNGDPAQPIDILALEETTSNTTTVQPIVDGLNAFYAYYTNPAGYAMSPYQATQNGGNTSGNGPNAMVYNTNTLQLVASVGVGTPQGSGNGEYRQVVRYEFAPAGYPPTTNNEFYVYVSHYKASSGSGNDAERLGEATIIRNDEAANLPPNSRVLYVGDYNPDDNSGEPAYQTICSNSAPNGIRQGQGVDPLNILWGPYTDASTTINWSSSTTDPSILLMLTESAPDLRYRDDLQVMTSNVYYDVAGGLQYVPGTYHSFGNNASLPYGSSVTAGGNTALNDLDPSLTNLYKLSAAQVLQDLTTATDHLPVVADYTIPIPSPYSPQSIHTVFIIVEENQNWASISGNAAAPYINNTLLPMASHAEQYFNPPGLHPSTPNYLWLEAGTNFGIFADGDPSSFHQSTTNHLVTLLKNAGISWTSFQEDISGTTCPLTAVNQYAPKHNPVVYFDDVTNTNNTGSTYCIANVRPFTELAGDLQSNVVTRYNFITPNLCDDMHGNGGCLTGNALITQGDTWLSNTVSTILGSQAYSNNGVIFITWDEGEGGDGPIGMIVISPLAKGGGYSDTIHYTHSSTLLTMQEIFNVGPLLGDASNATDLSDLFVFGAQLVVSPASGLTSSGTVGGPFSPGSQTYTLSNTGGVAMVWSVTNTVNWLTLSATNGTLAAGGSTNIIVSINATANSLSGGSYSDNVVFATSNGSGKTTAPVSLTVNNPSAQLAVSPASAFTTGGAPGGPFFPISQTYAVSNAGGASMNWTANNSASWLTLSATSGTLAAGASTNVTATINATANSLAAGGYSDTIGFTNTTNGAGNTTRAVSLSIGTFGFYDDFSTFASGNLVGQQGWTQFGGLSGSPVQVTGGQAGFTGGLTANNQTAYKNVTLTNETVFYGLTLTVTNAPNTNAVPYFAALYAGTNGTGVAGFRLTAESPDSAKTNYVLGVRITASASDPYTFGVTGLSYGTQYRVIVQAVAGGTNAILYVNPTSGNIGAQTQYAKNTVASGVSTVGSFAISQLDSGSIPSAGGLIGKVAVGDNFGTVYTELLGVVAPGAGFTAAPTSGAAPLTVLFSDSSSNSPTSWAWTFGDGGTSTSQNPSYTYTVPGSYTVTLIASNAGGSSTDTVANLISVYDPFAWWQFGYFGCTNCAQAQAGADPYGKGISNTNQFLLGLNPTNPASVFQIDSLATQGSNHTDVMVTWTTVGGITNVVQATAGATDGSSSYATNFIDLSPLIIIPGVGGQATNYLDASGATNSPARYYRIRFQQ